MQGIRGGVVLILLLKPWNIDSMTHLIVLLIDGNPYGYGKWFGL